MPIRAARSGLVVLLSCTLGAAACKTANSGAKVKDDLSGDGSGDPQCQMPDAPDEAGVRALADRFYQDDGLLTANLAMDDQDWDQLRNEAPPKACSVDPNFKYTKFKADLTVEGYAIGAVKIKKKSTCGSLSTSKPGIDIDKSDKDGASFVFPGPLVGEGLTRLIFNNSVQDPAYLRQCYSYQLMRDFNYPAPRCNFVKLCVNNKYKGIYINVETMDEAFAARNFNDRDGKGLMVEGDWTGHMTGRHADWYDDNPAAVFGVKFTTDEDLQANLNTPTFKAFLAVLAKDPATITQEDVATLGAFVDLDAYRKFFLWEHLLGQYDGANGNRNNHYIYFSPIDQRWVYLPWGMDQTMKGPPGSAYKALRLAKTYMGSPLLRAGLAADYKKLVAQISEPQRKAKAQAMGQRLKPFLPAKEQAKWEATLDNMTYNFWRELSADPVKIFGAN